MIARQRAAIHRPCGIAIHPIARANIRTRISNISTAFCRSTIEREIRGREPFATSAGTATTRRTTARSTAAMVGDDIAHGFRQSRDRDRDQLCIGTLDGTDSLPRRWPHRNRQQECRTFNSAAGPGSALCSVSDYVRFRPHRAAIATAAQWDHLA